MPVCPCVLPHAQPSANLPVSRRSTHTWQTYRNGASDAPALEVTTLGFGAMELRGGNRGPQLSEDQADKLLNAVLDAGINFIDTSIDYGLSEERIGKYIAHRRGEYFLASKCGCVPGGAQGEHVHTAENIRDGVENSLRLLKTDHLDLVQFHRSLTKEEFEAEGALQEALEAAGRGQGALRRRLRHAAQPRRADQACGVFDAFQIPYSALQREHEDVIARASKPAPGSSSAAVSARGAPTDWGRTHATT